MRANRWWKQTLVIAAVLLFVLSTALAMVAENEVAAAPSAISAASASSALGTSAIVTGNPPATPTSPHNGSLNVFDVFPGGATSEDPAVDYETVGGEPILNTFELLLAYNGSASQGGSAGGPNGFVPVGATCVPGTTQCTTDYGGGFSGVFNAAGTPCPAVTVDGNTNPSCPSGQPTYYTFPIDPAAKFYDSGTGASWPVYPTDVMFSVARAEIYSESDGVGTTAGWLVAQALLPNGSATYDGGLHYPYNTTPADIYGSMLVNNSTFCPSAAITGGNGCITFYVNGGGAAWPQFLELIGDEFAGAITSCGWYTYEGANLPGWSGTTAANGDGSCALPDGSGQTSTDGSTWASFLAGLRTGSGPESWDSAEKLLPTYYPAPNPNVQWDEVGSGPYYYVSEHAATDPGYTLFANPDYAQPSGCGGNLVGFPGQYTGYCDPAAEVSPTSNATGNAYPWNVNVLYSTETQLDTPGIAAYIDKSADLAGILLPTHTSDLVSLSASGKLNYFTFPTLSTFFLPMNLNWSLSAYSKDGFGVSGTPNIPADFFSGAAVRGLMTHAYPYATAENTAFDTDGVETLYEAGGPIANGMQYDPTNITYPYELNNGTPDASTSTVNSAGWWWSEGTTAGSQYYDPELAACLKTTCKFPIIGELGNPGLDIAISEYINQVEAITGDHVQPFTFDENFGGPEGIIPLQDAVGPGQGPMPMWNLGWAADNFDPEDYLIPLAFPNSTYTFSDAVEEQFALPLYDNVAACGHGGVPANNPTNYTADNASLMYWAVQPAINSSCEGVAYGVVNDLFYTSTHAPPGERAILYWAIQSILNALNLYVWYGQETEVESAAPWVELSSLNTNPTIGGGADNLWYMLHYVPTEYNVTFSETGLKAGASKWTIGAGSPVSVKTNGSGGGITFAEPSGALSYSISSPDGVLTGVTVTAGAPSATNTSVTVGTTDIDLVANFTPVSVVGKVTLSFQPSGLGAGTAYSVSISGTAGSNFSGTAAPLPVNFTVPVGSTWKYTVTGATGYKFSPKGTVKKVTATTPVKLSFTEETVKATFSEKGLAKGTPWEVVIDGISNPAFNETLSGDTPSLVATTDLAFGAYAFTTSSPTGYTNTVPAGAFQITSTKSIKETIDYIGAKVGFAESGLSKGTAWAVDIEENATTPVATLSGSTPTLSVSGTLPEGTYYYNVTSTGFPTTSGNFTISSAKAIKEKITFIQAKADFKESGLAKSTSWTVTITVGAKTVATLTGDKTSQATTTDLPQGTYYYNATASGYTTVSGQFNVTSKSTVSVTITFVASGGGGLPAHLVAGGGSAAPSRADV